MDFGKAACRKPLRELLVAGVTRKLDRKGKDQALVPAICADHQFGIDRLWRIVPDCISSLPVKQLGRARIQQLEVVVELGHGAHSGARAAYRVGLVNRNRRWHAFDLVNGRFVHAVKKLARVGREGFNVTALAFCKQGVKHQGRLAGAAWPGNYRQLIGANVNVKVFKVVLARSANADGSLGHGWGAF